MLGPSVVGWIRDHLLDNDLVLFLGAGFSCEAVNKLGIRLPLSSHLAEQLYDRAGFSTARPFAGERLEDLFESARRKLGDDCLFEFLQARLSAASIPAWYGYLADYFWYRIYTTNVDNIVEKAWQSRAGTKSDLLVIDGLEGRFVERDQLLGAIQYVRLNGSLESGIKGMTFSRRQYAARLAEEDLWVDHFVRDYFSHPTIFIGTDLDDAVLWSYIERRERIERERGSRDPRPKALLVSPDISPAKEPLLESLHIEPVRVTARDFFETLHGELAEAGVIETVLRRVLSRKNFPAELALSFVTTEIRRRLGVFHSSFREVRPRAKDPSYHGYYLLGTRATWDDLAAGLDAEREITPLLEAEVKAALADMKRARVVFLAGPAGSGKSTVLMRLALSIRQGGIPCFFAEGEDLPDWLDVRAALEGYDRSVVLVLDNAHKYLLEISEWAKHSTQLAHPPVLVAACRTSGFERDIGRIEALLKFVRVDISDLSDAEIRSILDILEREQLLGWLRGRGRPDQIRMFREFARRQLLVAMRETTVGPGFDKIIYDEFNRLPDDGRVIYTIAALPSAQHHTIRQEELIASSPYPLEQTLDTLKRSLKGIVVEVEAGSGVYQVRHPVIAEMIVDKVVPREVLSEAYVSYLRALSHGIPVDAGRRNRAWSIFWRLLNHRNLYQQFNGNVEHARRIYESLKKWVGSHGHFWLQYGSLELEYGIFDHAENYINQAKEILGEGHMPVMATYAHLLLKKANRTGDLAEADLLRTEGEAILLAQIESSGRRDPYPYHILGSQTLVWLRHRCEDKDVRKTGYVRLRRILEDGRRNHPGRRELKELLDEIKRDALMMGVPER